MESTDKKLEVQEEEKKQATDIIDGNQTPENLTEIKQKNWLTNAFEFLNNP